MRTYLLSLAAGLLVGAVYGVINVRSPAPPVVALVGLLGILLGEQVVPTARQLLAWQPGSIATVRDECARHVFGRLPGRARPAGQQGSEPGSATDPG